MASANLPNTSLPVPASTDNANPDDTPEGRIPRTTLGKVASSIMVCTIPSCCKISCGGFASGDGSICTFGRTQFFDANSSYSSMVASADDAGP